MALPVQVQQLLAQADPAYEAEITAPSSTIFSLDGGYIDDAGTWHTEFEVRELTGRDEEALGKVATSGRFITELLERGLLRVGSVHGREALDSLLAGDWETVLLAIRSVTFGDEVDFSPLCRACGSDYTVTVRLSEDIPRARLEGPDDVRFEYRGRHGNVYDVVLPTGRTQRMLLKTDSTAAEQNTLMLAECIRSIDGKPSLGRESVLDLPLADRRAILKEISQRRPGPRLEEVKTICPSCGAEDVLSISIAALFR